MALSNGETDHNEHGGTGDDAGSRGTSRWASLRRTIRIFVLRALALLVSFLLFAVLLTGGAAWYTSRPQFCRSCHIMEPYYVSWQQSSHHDVTCIKCHFPPGVAEEIRGKMLGLVQLAKYVTRSEGPRPVAEIPDASCLRSGCHETRVLAGSVDFRGIRFDHRPHLEEMPRGKKLRCTSCHSQIVQGSHMTVTTTTCFLCHFKGGVFNEGLGACTRCHQIPDGEFDLGGGAMFTHDLAYERGVDCYNCHGDINRGTGAVPVERCSVCHNRNSDLARRDDHEFMHRIHVTDHKVDCLDCHLAIEHSLDRDKIVHAASDCTSCHPNHHHEQVEMLQGRGSSLIPPQGNAMVAARIACPACHQAKTVSSTGTVLWKASVTRCRECHSDVALKKIESHYQELNALLTNLRGELDRVREALDKANLPADKKAALQNRWETLSRDVDFLSVARGIHNIHYATSLTKAAVDELNKLCGELKIPPAAVVIPELVR